MINKNCGIYKITSPTGKVYIGQSVDLKRRFSEYKGVHTCRFQPVIYRSLLKYGFEAHQFDIIEYCTEEELNCSERFWQDEFDVLGKDGLNCVLQECGEKRKEFSEEYRKDKSIKMSGEGNHMYGRRGDNSIGWGRFGDLNANWGNKHTKEQKEKWSIERTGCNSKARKEVIDVATGILYCTAREASDKIGVNYSTLRCMLQGNSPNTTSMVYLINYEKGDYKILQNREREHNTKVINTKTGVIYNSIKEASEKEYIKYGTLYHYLNNTSKNKSDLKILS